MTVESNTAGVRPSAAPIAPALASTAGRNSDWLADPITQSLMSRLPGAAHRFVACAPGRLDVMGGFAEYAGSSIVNLPIGGRVLVGVEQVKPVNGSTKGGEVTIHSTSASSSTVGEGCSNNGAITSWSVPLAQLFDPGGEPIDVARAQHLIDWDRAGEAWCALATLLEMCRARVIPPLKRGVVIAIGSTLQGLTGVGAETSVSAATAAALADMYDVTPETKARLAVCQCVANQWLDLPIGLGDAHCALHGEVDTLHHVDCSTASSGETINPTDRLSIGKHAWSVIGIECGQRPSDAITKFVQARVAAFMGRALIERIVRHEKATDSKWNGFLSGVSVEAYVERFRHRIPTKLKGSAFLERFGETGDPLTRIDPSCTYKVRSRTEHHIYEHTRVSQFLERLRRVNENSPQARESALSKAGALMYASHWSYGQRCGLGSVRADLLVNLLRQHGTEEGIFGAKITGRGCGGVVAVLVKPGPLANDAIGAARDAFRSRTGCSATLLKSTWSGALVNGVRKV